MRPNGSAQPRKPPPLQQPRAKAKPGAGGGRGSEQAQASDTDQQQQGQGQQHASRFNLTANRDAAAEAGKRSLAALQSGDLSLAVWSPAACSRPGIAQTSLSQHADGPPLMSLLLSSGDAEESLPLCETKTQYCPDESQGGALHQGCPGSCLHPMQSSARMLPHRHMLNTLSMQERMLRKAARLDPASYREQLERLEQLIARSAPAESAPQPDSPFRCRWHASPAFACHCSTQAGNCQQLVARSAPTAASNTPRLIAAVQGVRDFHSSGTL